MEITPEPPASPSRGSSAVRNVAVALLAVAGLLLMFGLGYGVSDLTSEEEVRIVERPASDGEPAAAQPTDQEQAREESGERSELAVGASILEETFEILQEEFVDKEILDERDFRDAAIRGAIDSLNDPYTEYLSPGDLALGIGAIETTYQGIGATVTDRNGVVQIVSPFRGSPAEEAGIRPGDIILAVDGESTEGWTSNQAVQRIRGPRGTEVVLTVQHTDLGPGPEIEDITIVRDEILIQSVFTEPRELIPGESGSDLVDRTGTLVDDILYINIAQFHGETPSELRSALRDAESGRYIGLILDVRGNPGGLLRQTVQATNEFLPDGDVILSEIDADGDVVTFGAQEGGIATSIPIVLVQDEASASGSEVLAAALVDNGRAVVVGVRSFGKGTVNQLHPLSRCGDPAGCGALYVTVGRWLRPNGQVIEGLGIAPDYEIPLTGDDYIDYGDLQVFAAIDILRGIEPPPPPERVSEEDEERPDIPNVAEREEADSEGSESEE
ncbi:MAG: S41 family peptidase [Chloroflexota bacterium]|nr:S41 family peptidase [Chloroflexota bacterium]